jgi:hypothetical protein
VLREFGKIGVETTGHHADHAKLGWNGETQFVARARAPRRQPFPECSVRAWLYAARTGSQKVC